MLKSVFVLRALKILTLFFPVLVSAPAFAQETYKLGFVDAVRIIDAAPQSKLALEQIEQELSAQEAALNALEVELQEMQIKLEAEGENMSDTDRSDLEQDIRKIDRRLNRGRDELTEDYNIRRREELEKLQRVVSEVIQKLAIEGEYDLIVQDPIVYVSPKVDMTQNVINELIKMAESAQ